MSSFKATILDLKGIYLTTPAVTAYNDTYDSPIRLKVTFEAHGEILHTILSKPLVRQQSTNNNNNNNNNNVNGALKYKAVFPKSSIVLPAIQSVATPVSSCSSEELPADNADDGIVFHVKASVIFDAKDNNDNSCNDDDLGEQYLGSTVLNVDSSVETNSVLMMVLPVKRAAVVAPVATTSLDSPVALPSKSKSFVGKLMKRTRSLTAAVRSPTSVMNSNNSANLNSEKVAVSTEVSRPKFELSDEAQMRIKFKMVEDAMRPRPRSHAEYLAQLRSLSRAAYDESSSGNINNRNTGQDHHEDNGDGSTNYKNSLVSSKDYESDDNDTADNVSRQSCSGPTFFEALTNFICAPNCGGVDVNVEVESMLRNVDSYGSSEQDSRFVPAVEDGYWKHYEFDEISMLTEPTLTE